MSSKKFHLYYAWQQGESPYVEYNQFGRGCFLWVSDVHPQYHKMSALVDMIRGAVRAKLIECMLPYEHGSIMRVPGEFTEEQKEACERLITFVKYNEFPSLEIRLVLFSRDLQGPILGINSESVPVDIESCTDAECEGALKQYDSASECMNFGGSCQ